MTFETVATAFYIGLLIFMIVVVILAWPGPKSKQ